MRFFGVVLFGLSIPTFMLREGNDQRAVKALCLFFVTIYVLMTVGHIAYAVHFSRGSWLYWCVVALQGAAAGIYAFLFARSSSRE